MAKSTDIKWSIWARDHNFGPFGSDALWARIARIRDELAGLAGSPKRPVRKALTRTKELRCELLWCHHLTSSKSAHVQRLVYAGRLSPQAAEGMVAKRGLPPFEIRRVPERWDPQGELTWSLPMTLAWILTRSMDEVREAWDAPRATESRWWLPNLHGRGFHLTRRPLVSVGELCSRMESASRAAHKSIAGLELVASAFETIREAAFNERIRMLAVPQGGSEMISIPSIKFASLRLCDSEVSHTPILWFKDDGYHDMSIARTEVMGEWPPDALSPRSETEDSDTAIAVSSQAPPAKARPSVRIPEKILLVQHILAKHFAHGRPLGMTVKGLHAAIRDIAKQKHNVVEISESTLVRGGATGWQTDPRDKASD